MIKKLWNRILNDKILFVIFIVVCAIVLFDLFVLVFDIVQFVIVADNSAALSNNFRWLNLLASGLTIIGVIGCFCYAIFRKK